MAAAKKKEEIQVETLSDRASLVPHSKWKDAYVSRKVSGHDDFDVMETAHKMRHNVLLYGPTGPGKTTFVRAYAAKNEWPLVVIPGDRALDPTQFFGKPRIESDGEGNIRTVWQDGPVTHMVRHGGVLYITEVNFLDPRIGVVLNPLLDGQRQIILLDHAGEVIHAHDDLLVVADFNPDYEGTRPLNEAFRNRFAFQIKWGYEREVEASLVGVKSIIDVAEQLRVAHNNGDLETPVSTNMLIEFEDIVAALSFRFAVDNFLNHFHDDEKMAVRNVLQMHRERILSELGIDDDGALAAE